MATEFVRVKDPDTGHEVSVPKRFAEAQDLEILDKPALDNNGRPLKAKPHVELAKADKPIDEESATKAAAAEAAEAAAAASGNTNAGSGRQSGGSTR